MESVNMRSELCEPYKKLVIAAILFRPWNERQRVIQTGQYVAVCFCG